LSWIKEGLPSRCITRDTSWGFPVPLEGYEGKVFYVWFDAPIGYISITEEYFDQKGEYEKWKDYWLNPKDTVLVQFMGKDNILFHTIIFPAMLMGTGDDYVLVNKLVSYNWLNAKGIKFSKSRGVGLNIRNALEILPADYWRFALISLLPEKSDTEFSIEVMMEKVNKELVGNFSNYIYRVLNMAYKKGYLKNNEYDEEYKEAMEIYNEIMESYEKIELRDALLGILKLSQYGNQLLNKYEPWKWKDREKVGKFIYLHLKIIHLLAKASFPIITKSAKDIFLMLGLAPFEEGEFNVKRPKILFRKLGDEFLEKLKSTIKYGKEGKEEEFSVKV
jgi:methionyl-tRNA synthetase